MHQFGSVTAAGIGQPLTLPVIPELILIVPFSAETWNFMESKIRLRLAFTDLFDCSFA
ncbi:MAG: hypothetical protein H7176_04875 [Bdellovibrionales bacterium]|nr:hypothetical protein [Massilia sp.]